MYYVGTGDRKIFRVVDDNVSGNALRVDLVDYWEARLGRKIDVAWGYGGERSKACAQLVLVDALGERLATTELIQKFYREVIAKIGGSGNRDQYSWRIDAAQILRWASYQMATSEQKWRWYCSIHFLRRCLGDDHALVALGLQVIEDPNDGAVREPVPFSLEEARDTAAHALDSFEDYRAAVNEMQGYGTPHRHFRREIHMF
ncbi:MAG: hypothetical protein NW208_09215 [Bryobacter sp.]|nr:hypothetical protein [Bryobacter sp.]